MNIEEAIRGFPPQMRTSLEIAYSEGGAMARAMLERGAMDAPRALMVGLALSPTGRPLLEDALDSYARVEERPPSEWPEVIVGGGAHAAIYAAVRQRLGKSLPLVLERERRFGGTFAMTARPSFFLNSRNRPGPAGAPGSRDALNVIPAAPMQPSDLGGSEYQNNADLGLVVRCTLALNAMVRRANVEQIERTDNDLVVITDRGQVRARRVIVATGLGEEAQLRGAATDGQRVLNYSQFMRRFDQMDFPLQNLGRVAVIGGGDGGRTVVEALTGYGPYMGGSVASLDYVQRIDWYGVGSDMTKKRWLECNRTRYKPLAALFPGDNARNDRVRGLRNCQISTVGFNGVQIDADSYDTVIVCRGYKRKSLFDERLSRIRATGAYGVIVGKASDDRSLVMVGPAADLPYEDQGEADVRDDENRVALFRLAERTAALAMNLPGV
jgi:hypothetical protein